MRILAVATLSLLLCHCGSSNSSPDLGGTGGAISMTDPNVVAVTVDPGPPGLQNPYTDGLFVNVTLCVPGTSTCQTIDHMLVDTGSVGVRVLESELTLGLPAVTSATGANLAECTPFVDGTSWGPVRQADVQVGQEAASNLPIQLIGELTYPMPTDCSGTPITDLQTLSSKGIFGVGTLLQDCGPACEKPVHSLANPGWYYGCTTAQAGGCAIASIPTTDQVSSPVAAFLVDNNGSFIRLPNIPAGGSPLVAGELVFGIGTQSNNGLGDAKVIPLDPNTGYASTNFPIGGTGYTSYLDSGSNGLFFLNAGTANLKQCTGGLSQFYCPSSSTNLSASMPSFGGGNAIINFSVANASRLSADACAFSNLAGPMPGFPNSADVPGFDWGLPFYFGRTVFTAIEGQNTPAGLGPYFAF
jgi:hypothetical protein